MDEQSHIEPVPDLVTTDDVHLLIGAIFLPSDDYATSLSIFPGTCAYPWFKMEGEFSIRLTVFDKGKPACAYQSASCDELGNIRIEADTFLANQPGDKCLPVLIELLETQRIPVDVYISAVHRKTGVYISYPGLPFIGDKVFPEVHANQLENTTFWPGMVVSPNSEVCTIVLNPFDQPFFYQIHLISRDGVRMQSKTIKAGANSCSFQSLAEGFDDLASLPTATSICIASQFKHIGYVVFRDRETGIFTSLDHTHTYQMI